MLASDSQEKKTLYLTVQLLALIRRYIVRGKRTLSPRTLSPTLGHYPPGCIYLSVSDKVELWIPNMWFTQTP